MVITCAAAKAQMIMYANSSTITLVGGIKISTDAVPFGQYLRAHQMLGTEILHAARMRAQYHGGDFIAAANEYAFEMSKMASLMQLLGSAKNSRGASYESRKKADAKKAAQRYAAKRGATKKANTTPVVKAENTDNVYTITNGAEYDFSN
ncbi:MAG: hypothetical protein IJS88_00575 [Alphaproteobacteria bacterium]|nr:hypothetical protein [Alphaproteobacteria bacterium]